MYQQQQRQQQAFAPNKNKRQRVVGKGVGSTSGGTQGTSSGAAVRVCGLGRPRNVGNKRQNVGSSFHRRRSAAATPSTFTLISTTTTTATASTSIPSDTATAAPPPSVPQYPGMYYDPIKKKYFKIEANHVFGSQHPSSLQSVTEKSKPKIVIDPVQPSKYPCIAKYLRKREIGGAGCSQRQRSDLQSLLVKQWKRDEQLEPTVDSCHCVWFMDTAVDEDDERHLLYLGLAGGSVLQYVLLPSTTSSNPRPSPSPSPSPPSSPSSVSSSASLSPRTVSTVLSSLIPRRNGFTRLENNPDQTFQFQDQRSLSATPKITSMNIVSSNNRTPYIVMTSSGDEDGGGQGGGKAVAQFLRPRNRPVSSTIKIKIAKSNIWTSQVSCCHGRDSGQDDGSEVVVLGVDKQALVLPFYSWNTILDDPHHPYRKSLGLETMTKLYTGSDVFAIEFDPLDSNLIFLGCRNGTVQRFDLLDLSISNTTINLQSKKMEKRVVREPKGFKGIRHEEASIQSMKRVGAHQLVTMATTGEICVWNIQPSSSSLSSPLVVQIQKPMYDHRKSVGFDVNPEGTLVAAAGIGRRSRNCTIAVWCLSSGRKLWEHLWENAPLIHMIKFMAKGSQQGIWASNGNVVYWFGFQSDSIP